MGLKPGTADGESTTSEAEIYAELSDDQLAFLIAVFLISLREEQQKEYTPLVLEVCRRAGLETKLATLRRSA